MSDKDTNNIIATNNNLIKNLKITQMDVMRQMRMVNDDIEKIKNKIKKIKSDYNVNKSETVNKKYIMKSKLKLLKIKINTMIKKK